MTELVRFMSLNAVVGRRLGMVAGEVLVNDVTDCRSSFSLLTFRLRYRVLQDMKAEDAAKETVVTDRWVKIRSKALRRKFSPPATFDHLDGIDRLQEALEAWPDALWFLRDAVAAGKVCERYVDD